MLPEKTWSMEAAKSEAWLGKFPVEWKEAAEMLQHLEISYFQVE